MADLLRVERLSAAEDRCCDHLVAALLNQPRNCDRAVGDSFNTSGALSR
jgi:hypothetical protein